MQTRRQRALKAETLEKLPVEILLCIVSNVFGEDDLLALSQVNKALREVSATVLFKKLYVDVDLETYSDLLQARTVDPWVRPAIRELHIDSWTKKGPPEHAKLGGIVDPLVRAITAMTGLVKISLASWMFNDDVFYAIRLNQSIKDVTIIGPVQETTLGSILVPIARLPAHPLFFDLVMTHDSSTGPTNCNVLTCIRELGGQVRSLTIHLDEADALPPAIAFDAILLPSVTSLRFEVPPKNAEVAGSWMNMVPDHLPTLNSLVISVTEMHKYGAAGNDPLEIDAFHLTGNTWLSGQTDVKQGILDEMFAEWEQMPVMGCEFGRDIRTGVLEGVTVILDFGAIIRSPMISSLAHVLSGVTRLDLHAESFADSPEWEDWPGTVAAFAPLTSLQTLSLMLSLTPKPTMEVVVGCKPECIDKAVALNPSLETDMALLNGDFGLWTLGIDLNLRRIELLGPHLPLGAQVSWLITDTAESETAVNFAGVVKAATEEGKPSMLRMMEVQEDVEWQSGQRCTVCHADMIVETPMELLMACPVEEVRASLSRTNEGWEEWKKNNPLGPESTTFERWLRA